MSKIIGFLMYVLWILTLIAVVATTLTNFQYADLNMIAILLFAFTLANSFFALTHRNK